MHDVLIAAAIVWGGFWLMVCGLALSVIAGRLPHREDEDDA